MGWNTKEGGPCLLRPSGANAADSPDPDHETWNCVTGYDQDWRPILKTESAPWICKNAWADENNIIHGGKYKRAKDECVGPYNTTVDTMTEKEKMNRHATGWSNQFALPWEVSSYWAFTTSREDGQRAQGCPGLDTPFEEWPLRTRNSPIFASPAMDCPKNTYRNLAGI